MKFQPYYSNIAFLSLPILGDELLASFFSWFDTYQHPRAEPFEMSQQLLLLSALAGNVTFTSFISEERGAQQGYDFYRFFNSEPSQAVVVGTEGYCFAGFRGTVFSFDDLVINFIPGMDSVCGTGERVDDCCDVRIPYNKEYNAPYRQEMEDALQECLDATATPCLDELSCVVLTGFSQGAAIAGVASLYLHTYKPRVITFGEPASLGRKECSLAQTDEWYRYVNTWNDFLFTGSIGYDLLSVFPLPFSTRQVGHMILFPSKKPFDNTTSSGLAYLGLNPEEAAWKLKPISWAAHDIVESPGESGEFHPGYLNHLTFLMQSEGLGFPLIIEGFATDFLCSQHRECKSGQCRWRIFRPRVCA